MLTSDPVSSVCGERESHQTTPPLIIPQCHVHCIHSATYLSWTVPLSFILSSDFYQTINFFSFFTITPLFRNSIPFTLHSFLIMFLPTLLSLCLHSRNPSADALDSPHWGSCLFILIRRLPHPMDQAAPMTLQRIIPNPTHDPVWLMTIMLSSSLPSFSLFSPHLVTVCLLWNSLFTLVCRHLWLGI